MASTNRNKTPEGKLVLHPCWQGGTITNDQAVIKSMGIKSPVKHKFYAIAYHKKSKTEFWIRTQERFKRWKNTILNYSEYEIKFNNQ
jgi:hypothetical protein